ncbi:MAG: DUF4384 domain-containing protein [Candidatus Tectomicrobia bacterium]|nr:DUF4384 domain-containing protein [Candidatus Tectomicrobia bacterium]
MQATQRIARAARRLAQPYAFALALAAVLVVTPACADVELGIEEIGEKTIRVETDTPDAAETTPLRVNLEPAQASFRVDEPIRFRIRGNKAFFLYLYSVDKDTDEVTLLLPTREGQRHNKYPANRTLMVPNEGQATFLADEPGRERLLMVASTTYLPVKSRWYRKGSDYYVGSTAELSQEFGAKNIRVEGPDKTRDDKVLVKTVMVRISGERTDNGDQPAAEAASHVWLTTKGNRTDYGIGDRIEAVFGADRDGWIHLYVVEPSGRHARLKSYEVRENRTYTARAVASDPAGKHALVAVYTEDNQPSRSLAAGADMKALSLLDAAPKGVDLVEDEPKPMAVYRFRITDY